RRSAPDFAKEAARKFRSTKLPVGRLLEAIWSDENHIMTDRLTIGRHGLGHILKNPSYSDNRRGINPFTLGLVVERDIPARDRRAERGAGFGDAVDGGGELRHDLRLLRIAEVQAIRRSHGYSSGAGDFACGFGYG